MFKREFEAVNVSIIAISCEKSILVIITSLKGHTRTGEKICLQTSAGDPYDLYGFGSRVPVWLVNS